MPGPRLDPRRRRLLAAGGVLALAAGAAGWWAFGGRYYTARELDRPAYPLRRVDLDPEASRGGVDYFGKLRFDLYIGRSGRVDRVEVLESTLPPDIAGRVVRAFREARWEPASRRGRSVRSVKRVEVEYEPPPGARPPMRPDA